MNVEPQTDNRKPRLEVRGKLGSKTLYYPHDTKIEVKINVCFLQDNFSVLPHFQVFLPAEMHVLIFLAVVLFAPPCADSLSGKII